MTRKTILTAGLLGFVALSLTVAVADVSGWRRGASRGAASQDTTPRLKALFFHAPHRCPTCKKIEAYAHEALQPEIESGRLTWEVADYTTVENAALVEQLKVLASTVVIVEQRGDKIVCWKNLEGVWDHTHDREEFVAFMRDAWKDFQENP